MRACAIAACELTPVNRSRSRTGAARSAARGRVGGSHTGDAPRAPILHLNTAFMPSSRDRKPQARRVRRWCLARSWLGESLNRKSKRFSTETAVVGAMREIFCDVPIDLSHGVATRGDPGSAQPLRRGQLTSADDQGTLWFLTALRIS